MSSSDSEAEVITILVDPVVWSWGTHDGELFCCNSGENIVTVNVVTLGSEHDDVLAFLFPGGPELREVTSKTMTATIYGGDGNDTIKGSNRDSASYTETLHGEAGFDDIQGNGGDDFEDGVVAGLTVGGNGDDDIFGGEGGDVLCGDGESSTPGDYIVDGTETGTITPKNLICGANSADEIVCNADNTDTDPWSDDLTLGDCNPVLTEKPGQCP